MAVPVLMTLFTDDAVEVRYSDQSCLQLSPCGSTFVHHESPGQLVHPAHGMKTINQRCEFVTSDYRQKVLHALDFRNRFAERPFLCKPLLEEDQIMALYARIPSAAWPKGLEQANFEYMMDGGIRLISEDEYASIMLSPHRQDFTVCHLCGISSDKPRRRSNVSKAGCLKKKADMKTNDSQEKATNAVIPKTLPMENTNRPSKSDPSNVQGMEKSRDELNISPISFASTQLSRESSPVSESEGKRYSTPTNALQDIKTQKFKAHLESLDGSFLQFAGQPNSQKQTSLESTLIENKDCNFSNTSKHSSDSDSSVNQKHVHWLSTGSGGSDISQTGSVEGSSNSLLLYTWVTKHFSCEECPASWKHVLNMARAAIDNRQELEKYASATSIHITQKPKGVPKKINPEKYCMAPLPEPLPLTCPGQHLHRQYGKYIHNDDKDIVENITTLSKGRLKIILIDGIVFRVVRLASTKFVEIYPGDGSVIVSQGLGGHFYRHLIPKGGQLDERTYSLKALPPTTKSATYSIEKLIKRASRFLLQSSQEDKVITDRTACWKYRDSTPVEPLAATLLEECSVPGHGRFSAFSDGHVRILFEDRTALDMACDFTKRIVSCMEHSHDEQEKSTLQQQLDQHISMESRSKQGLCKLLLPNGQYQIVDSCHPGIYKKYTDAAVEWASWVNSSPKQRKIFYQEWNQPDDTSMMVTKELQKIKCFNYLADNPFSNIGPNKTEFETASLIPDSNIASNLGHGRGSYHRQEHSTLSHDSSNHMTNSHLHTDNWRSKSHTKPHLNPSRELEMMRGFDSVREALLKTSNAIKDIDEIIEKRSGKS